MKYLKLFERHSDAPVSYKYKMIDGILYIDVTKTEQYKPLEFLWRKEDNYIIMYNGNVSLMEYIKFNESENIIDTKIYSIKVLSELHPMIYALENFIETDFYFVDEKLQEMGWTNIKDDNIFDLKDYEDLGIL